MSKANNTKIDTYDVTFITVSHPAQLRQRETQKAIRRRVMRDIGKSRRKRSRPITFDLDVPEPCTVPSSVVDIGQNGINENCVGLLGTHVAKTLHPYGYYAVEPDERARQLFHFSGKTPSSIGLVVALRLTHLLLSDWLSRRPVPPLSAGMVRHGRRGPMLFLSLPGKRCYVLSPDDRRRKLRVQRL